VLLKQLHTTKFGFQAFPLLAAIFPLFLTLQVWFFMVTVTGFSPALPVRFCTGAVSVSPSPAFMADSSSLAEGVADKGLPGATLAGASIGPSVTQAGGSKAKATGILGFLERHFPPVAELLKTKAEELTPHSTKHAEPKLANLTA
jgi:hypothetical protein